MVDPYHIVRHLPTQNMEFQPPRSWHIVQTNSLGFWTEYFLGDSRAGKTTCFQTAQKAKLEF